LECEGNFRVVAETIATSAQVIAAFVLAPATIPVGVVAWALMNGSQLRESTVVGSIYAAFTYGASLLIGVPLFRAFSRRGWTAWGGNMRPPAG
jgi:hypothetical protein